MEQRATPAYQRQAADVMHIPVASRAYHVISDLDKYSWYILHQTMLLGMDAVSIG